MIKLNVSVNDDLLIELQSRLANLSAGSMPATAAAMKGGAEYIAGKWRQFAAGGSLEGVKPLDRPNRSYLAGVKVRSFGPFDYEIYNETKAAERIEHGTPEVDMKKTHTKGPRSRVSSAGIPYLIVPFRWGTPGRNGQRRVGFRNIMPDAVWNLMKNRKKFDPSKVLVSADKSAVKTPNARGEMVGRAQYSNAAETRRWGDRLTADMGGEGNMNGMVRMLGEDGKAAGYFTFRVISARQPKGWEKRPHSKPWEKMWVKEAVDPRNVTGALAGTSRGFIDQIVNEAIREDLGV